MQMWFAIIGRILDSSRSVFRYTCSSYNFKEYLCTVRCAQILRVFVRDTAFVRHFAVSDGTACCPFAVTSRPKINLIFCLLWLRASADVYPCTGCTHFACAPAAGRQSMLPYSSKISINNRCPLCERGLGGGGGGV